MKFLVVIPKFTANPAQDYIFPVGIGYIAASLRQHGFSVKGLDLNRFDAPPGDVLAQTIRDDSIDVVATGTISAHYNKVKAVLDGARKAKPRIITILGGGVMSSEPAAMMDALNAHFGVIGEGERTIVELAQALTSTRKFSEVNGLVFREPDGHLATTAPRGPIRDLDSLPLPDEELLTSFYQTQPHVYNLVSSRSCPFKCTFCYHPIGDIYRQRNLDDIFREVESSFHKYSPFHYRIIDELFSMKRERVLEFCRRIKPYKVKWDVQMRVSDVDAELLQTMRDAGCVLISYGLESGSQPVLESMRKRTKVPDLIRAVDLTYSSRLQVQGAFIFGDPAETQNTAVETFSLWLKNRKAGIGMWPIEIYPGTSLYKDAVKKGVIPDPALYIANGCHSINLMSMPERDALQILLLMYLLNISYNHIPGRVVKCQPGRLIAKGSGEQSQLFNVKVKCPHCGEVVDYPDMPMYGGLKWVCHSCNRRFDVQPLSQWRHWPASFQLSHDYSFQEGHVAEMLRFLKQQDWLGTKIQMPGYLEVVLFGVHYLVPASVKMDDIRFGLMKIFMASEDQQRLDPVVIYDGDYAILHNPFYLNHRLKELVQDWRARNCSVAIAGTSPEIQHLLQWTCLKDANVAGLLPVNSADTQMASLGYPVLNLEALTKRPPNVLLVSAIRNQRQMCELFGGILSRLGVEIEALYSSGTSF
jgi:anaerobic magnesium-protoporphyrin IX monomethyl ester cyclase